jgi:hypothetical protein
VPTDTAQFDLVAGVWFTLAIWKLTEMPQRTQSPASNQWTIIGAGVGILIASLYSINVGLLGSFIYMLGGGAVGAGLGRVGARWAK